MSFRFLQIFQILVVRICEWSVTDAIFDREIFVCIICVDYTEQRNRKLIVLMTKINAAQNCRSARGMTTAPAL